jgi:hypothetical protein
MVSDGWPRVVSGLKSLLETGDVQTPSWSAQRSRSAAQ